MFGFPVSLRLNNALLGKPAERSGKAPSTVTLKPGAQAVATVTDFSSCQAPVSDTVRVYPPNQRAFVDRRALRKLPRRRRPRHTQLTSSARARQGRIGRRDLPRRRRPVLTP